jgi:hypothetical protein
VTTDPPTGLDSSPRTRQYERDLTLDLVQVTEAAALAAHAWVGRGDKNSGDQAAVTAMRDALAQLPVDGIVVIGEGEKDEAPMLNNGERVGTGTVARATGRDARDMTVCLLHRPRHENLIRQCTRRVPGSDCLLTATCSGQSWLPWTAVRPTCSWVPVERRNESSERAP